MSGWEIHVGIHTRENILNLTLTNGPTGILREHKFIIYINVIESKFYNVNISWDEMTTEDVPASLNYVLKTTGSEKISFVCLSFGCTLFFMALIAKPELNNAIYVAIAIAPTGSFLYSNNPFVCDFLYPYGNELKVPNNFFLT